MLSPSVKKKKMLSPVSYIANIHFSDSLNNRYIWFILWIINYSKNLKMKFLLLYKIVGNKLDTENNVRNDKEESNAEAFMMCMLYCVPLFRD
jgi:hypothetical protein